MVAMQQFSLRWNNYTSNILQIFSEHLSSESLVDVTLSCQGRFVRAHKIILSACSPYFQEVFANHSDKHPLIILKGIKYEELQSIIKFMYTGEIKVHEAQLEDLLAAAEILQVKGLTNVRKKYERGEITSLNQLPKLVTGISTPPASTPVKKPPQQDAKPIIAVIAPKPPSLTRPEILPKPSTIPVSPNFPANSAIPPPPCNVVLANVSPSKSSKNSTNLSIPKKRNRNVATSKSRAQKSIRNVNIAPAPTVSVRSATVVAISPKPTIKSASLMPSATTTTTSTMDTPVITCVTGNFVEPNETQPTFNNNPILSAADFASLADRFPMQSLYICAANTSVNAPTTVEKSTTDVQTPRIRKRRKMSHTVNELAKETVFASNGTVFLEPDDAVAKNRSKTPNETTSLCKKNGDKSAEINEKAVQKGKDKIEKKNVQHSSLMNKRSKNKPKIPRPPNAFMIFANEWRRNLAIEHPKETNQDISVRLGVLWKGLSVKSKEAYYKLAKKLNEDHKRKYPDYFYSPKEARLRKILKNDLMTNRCADAALAKDSDDPEMMDAYGDEEEERDIVEFTDSSEYEDDDVAEIYENPEKIAKIEHDDDVFIAGKFVNDDNSVEKSSNRSKRNDDDSSVNKANSSRT